MGYCLSIKGLPRLEAKLKNKQQNPVHVLNLAKPNFAALQEVMEEKQILGFLFITVLGIRFLTLLVYFLNIILKLTRGVST